MEKDKEKHLIDAQIEATRKWAYFYLEHGFSFFPTSMQTKVPSISWKEFQDRQPTLEEVDDWFDNGVPDGSGGLTKLFGLGIVTGAVSDLVVVDCDNEDAFHYATVEGGIFSPIMVKTTRGWHFWFRHPGHPVPNKAGATETTWREFPPVAGLDLRGDGGYVAAPPTWRFDSEGKLIHQYRFETAHSLEMSLEFLPQYPGIALVPPNSAQISNSSEFSFESLSLEDARVDETIWNQIKELVRDKGRKLEEGEGRNVWVCRYVGSCLTSGMEEEQIPPAVEQFMAEFFADPLPEQEYKSTIRSIIQRDKARNPHRYEAKEKPNPVREKAISLITPSTLSKLKKLTGGNNFLVDPFISSQSITQVVGFNGHGKTLWLMSLLWSASMGKSFGAGTVTSPLRVLYLDYELSATTISSRIEQLTEAIGEMSENMVIWAQSVCESDLDLNEGQGISNLSKLLEETNPQVVVIDTVRSAWQGMDENSPSAWVKVNRLCIAIRNSGRAVVFVHHRNKPSSDGMGREAGSTAQLKDLDTQIIVTKVIEDREQAVREAALPDSVTKVVVNAKGATDTAWGYLRNALPEGAELQGVFQISFAKVRQVTENHTTTYVGIANEITTGKSIFVSSKSPRQKAEIFFKNGKTPMEIAQRLRIPCNVITRWLPTAEGTIQ